MGTEHRERRAGMDEFSNRLTRIETLVETELGEDGRIHSEIADVADIVTRIDDTLRGSNGAGLGERVRKLEKNQSLIITGLGLALTAAARVAWEWSRTKIGL